MMMRETEKNTKNRKKLVPQVRCSAPKRTVCNLETGVNWQLEEN